MRSILIPAACSLACAAALLGPARADDELVTDTVRHYSFRIPARWERMDRVELRDFEDFVRAHPTTGQLGGGFRPRGSRPGSFPFILVVTGPGLGRASYEDMERHVPAGLARGSEKVGQELKGMGGGGISNDPPVLDRARNRFSYRFRMTTPAGMALEGRSVSHFGADSLVTVICWTRTDDTDWPFRGFAELNDSFHYDPGHEFRPAQGTFESRQKDAKEKLWEHIGQGLGVLFFLALIFGCFQIGSKPRPTRPLSSGSARRYYNP